MAYSSEVVQRARNRLAQAKEDRESENRQHLAQAYAKVPRIKEIDILLRRTMAQAAQAAFLQGSDGRELLEQARRQNLELQQERALLVYENFEEGYLDETPICEVCGGTGYLGSNMCECLAELCRRKKRYPSSPVGRRASPSSGWTTTPTTPIPNTVPAPGPLWSAISRIAAGTP